MIEINHLNKCYRNTVIYDDFNIAFKENSVTAIIGPSGCGKTTLLRIMAGLEPFEKGRVDGIRKGGISFVFQEDRLLPWLSVYDNIALVLRSQMNHEEADRRIMDVLSLLDMKEAKKMMPNELSGGMQRRVAIGRALAYDSDLILMDEPFKGLDDKLKNEILVELIKVWDHTKKTIILVTHDLEDAYRLADEVFEFSGSPVRWTRMPIDAHFKKD
jgi:NitT/TauT family transport system ATP-binding protein